MEYNLDQWGQLLHGDFKCEVFYGNNEVPNNTHYCHSVNSFIDYNQASADFPTIETFFRMFVDNKQDVFEKLYLDANGHILTRFVFSKSVVL